MHSLFILDLNISTVDISWRGQNDTFRLLPLQTFRSPFTSKLRKRCSRFILLEHYNNNKNNVG